MRGETSRELSIAVLLAAALVGCETVARRDRPGPDRPARWRLVVVDRLLAHEWEMVSHLGLDSAGRLHVTSSTSPGIQVLVGQGRRIGSIGDSGDGELGEVAGMNWDTAGNLWVVDRDPRRFVVFDRTGSFLRSVPRHSNGNADHWRGGFDVRGRLYDPAYGPGGGTNPVLTRVREDGAVVDTVRIPYLPTSVPSGRMVLSVAPGAPGEPVPAVAAMVMIDIPFAPTYLWRFDPAGFLWYGRTDEYRIFQTRLDGDTVQVHERPYRPRLVTPAEKEELLARSALRDTSRIPSSKPIFEALYPDDSGRLWVRLAGDDARPVGERTTVFDVFDDKGYVASVEAGFWTPVEPAPAFRGDTVYLVSWEEAEMGSFVLLRALIDRSPAEQGVEETTTDVRN